MPFSIFIMCFLSSFFFWYVCTAAAALLSVAVDNLTLLLCLNPILAWHPSWTSRATNSLDPQLCGFMISLISLARLKLAQIYLSDVAILAIQVKYTSISLHIAGGSREEYSQCPEVQPWLKLLETAQCWQNWHGLQKLFLSWNCSNPSYTFSNNFVLSVTCYVPYPVLHPWCAASLTALVIFLFCYSSAKVSTFGGSSTSCVLPFFIISYDLKLAQPSALCFLIGGP